MARQDANLAEMAVAPDDVPESVRKDVAENRGSSSGVGAGTHISTFADLLQFAGTWSGDDLEDLLADVYATRGEAEF